MKYLCLLSFLLVVAAARVYDTAHDDFDNTQVVSNPSILREYNHCFLDTGPCNEIAGFFKQLIQEAVLTACAHCTSAQKRLAHNHFEALERYLPEQYELFKQKYDPNDFYFKAYRAAIAEH